MGVHFPRGSSPKILDGVGVTIPPGPMLASPHQGTFVTIRSGTDEAHGCAHHTPWRRTSPFNPKFSILMIFVTCGGMCVPNVKKLYSIPQTITIRGQLV